MKLTRHKKIFACKLIEVMEAKNKLQPYVILLTLVL